MSTVLCLARHPIDLAGGATISPGQVKTGVDLTNAFNAALLSHNLIYQLPDNYTSSPTPTPTAWSPPSTLVVCGDTSAHLASANPVPSPVQLVVELDTGKMKLGDGTHHYGSLSYVSGGGGGNVDGGTP